MWLTTPILWLTLGALPVAHARKTHTREISMTLPAQPEPHPLGRTGPQHSVTTWGIKVRGQIDEVTTDGGKLKLTCGARDRRIRVEVGYDTGNYPEHLPEELRCTVGNTDVIVHIESIEPLYTDISELQVGPDAAAEWRRRAGHVSIGGRSFKLPAETTFTDTTVVARSTEGPFWHGVSCKVTTEPEGQMLTVLLDDGELPDASGHCLLPTGSGQAVDISVELVTVPAPT